MTDVLGRARWWIVARSWIFPWISLAWGFFSGVLIARDFAHGWRVLLFSIGLMLFSVLLSLWFSWMEGVAESAPQLRGLAARVHARATLVEWAGITATQMALQYIVMFSITFLFFAKAWFLIFFTVILGVTIMWDPWFQRLMRRGWYENTVRCLGALLATSFVLSVLIPGAMHYYSWIVAGVAVGAAFPWRRFWQMRRRHLGWSRLLFTRDMLPLIGVILVAIFNGQSGKLVPPLSVWVRDAGVGEGVVGRELTTRFEGEVSLARFLEAQQGDGVCCWTPLVAPRALRIGMVHEWRVDGHVVDRISLGEAAGLDGTQAYRTYSCKHSFPGIRAGAAIECVAFLASGQEVGRIDVDIDR